MESYFSITFVDQAMYFQALRELYEAYVIHCFMRLVEYTSPSVLFLRP